MYLIQFTFFLHQLKIFYIFFYFTHKLFMELSQTLIFSWKCRVISNFHVIKSLNIQQSQNKLTDVAIRGIPCGITSYFYFGYFFNSSKEKADSTLPIKSYFPSFSRPPPPPHTHPPEGAEALVFLI